MIVMAMPPQHQLFQHEEHQDAEQDGRRHAVRVAVLQRMRQDFQKSRAEQRADGIGDQHIDALRASREVIAAAATTLNTPPASETAMIQARVLTGNQVRSGERRGLYAEALVQPDQARHAPGTPITAIGKVTLGLADVHAPPPLIALTPKRSRRCRASR